MIGPLNNHKIDSFPNSKENNMNPLQKTIGSKLQEKLLLPKLAKVTPPFYSKQAQTFKTTPFRQNGIFSSKKCASFFVAFLLS